MKSVIVLLICLWILAFRLNGDMGSIPFYPTAVILEPNQRALIAYNGLEEILILSTDLKADRETKVLEIMPLPSEPAVTNADVEIFQKVTAGTVRCLGKKISCLTGSGYADYSGIPGRSDWRIHP